MPLLPRPMENDNNNGAMNINAIVLSGTASSEVTLSEIGDTGGLRAVFSLEYEGDRRTGPHHIQVECIGPTGKVAANHIHKGKRLVAKGSIATSTWKDGEVWRSRVYIKAEALDLLV